MPLIRTPLSAQCGKSRSLSSLWGGSHFCCEKCSYIYCQTWFILQKSSQENIILYLILFVYVLICISYSWSCSLRPELCLSGSSPPPLGRPHGRETLPPPSSPHVDPLQADPQEIHNVLQNKKKCQGQVQNGLKKSLIHLNSDQC